MFLALPRFLLLPHGCPLLRFGALCQLPGRLSIVLGSLLQPFRINSRDRLANAKQQVFFVLFLLLLSLTLSFSGAVFLWLILQFPFPFLSCLPIHAVCYIKVPAEASH